MASTPADLVWEIVRSQNSYLVKRKSGGGVQFSRDPLNLTNLHSRKYAGFVNDKAIGVVPNEKGGVKVISKKAADVQKPAKCTTSTTFHGGKTSRSTYKAIANQTAKNGYRPDLRAAAVSRASAIRQSQREKKPEPEKKVRGKKAAAAESS
ncbi:ribosomal L28e/Mak16 [Microdochium trichocladiopsis]|uniref:Ribosomal L28e/Mak16 n=1 Tax=Microdochium trichocladiopsis TaxID=1682393 RepID=A0A9P9BW91_9PEZI|nr:ribosomal L28e/Mak16 [Microdochium trichocladiopsis]KAH7041128.1 ribosomal L28e/Mak16 [Microdochium trichocladiopsis]